MASHSDVKIAPIFLKGFSPKVSSCCSRKTPKDLKKKLKRGRSRKSESVFDRTSVEVIEIEQTTVDVGPDEIVPDVINSSLDIIELDSPVQDNSDPYFLNEDTETELLDDQTTATRNNLVWTEKHKPLRGEDVIAQSHAVNEINEWLFEWDKKRRELLKAGKRGADSDEEEVDGTFNSILLVGEPGIGKTSAVYAVAKEFGIKVFEMNCSGKRSGKIVSETLHEASQSLHLGRVASDSGLQPASSIMNFFKVGNAEHAQKKRKISKDKEEGLVVLKNIVKNSLSVSSNSIILFDDCDVLFEEDELFWRSVKSLIEDTKKPVIFTASQFIEPTLTNIPSFKVINMKRPSLDQVKGLLTRICEDEGVDSIKYKMEDLILRNRFDIRRCINQMQFDLAIETYTPSPVKLAISLNKTDETQNHDEHLHNERYSSMMLTDALQTKYALMSTESRRVLYMNSRPLPELPDRVRCSEFTLEILDALRPDASGVLDIEDQMTSKHTFEQSLCSSVQTHARRTRRFQHYLDTLDVFIDDDDKAKLLTMFDRMI